MRPQAARASPGQGAPQGRPARCCAAGACGRLPAPCTGCKRGAGPPLAPAPTQLPAGGGAGKSRGCCVWGNMCRRRGRPQAARASPGQGAPAGRPPAAAQRGPAAGFLRLVRAVNGAPTRRLPLPHAAACRGRGPLPGKCRGTCKRGGSPANRPLSFNFRAFFPPDSLKPP